METKRIITCAITGNWGKKENNPNIPITPEEAAKSADEAINAGAAVIHIHVRDDNGVPTCDPERFKLVVDLIKAKHPDVVINMTSSGEHVAPDETRIAPFYTVKPEIGSFDCGTLNWMYTTTFENNPKFLEKLAKAYLELNVKPEIEIFDTGMVDSAKYYIKTGLIKAPAHFAFILGSACAMQATPYNVCYLKNLIPEGSTFSANGMGPNHIPVILTALALGGHVRVGLEDNIYFRKGEKAESNAQFVKQAADIIRGAGLEVATPEDARRILSITR